MRDQPFLSRRYAGSTNSFVALTHAVPHEVVRQGFAKGPSQRCRLGQHKVGLMGPRGVPTIG